jgi:hypothetical protein
MSVQEPAAADREGPSVERFVKDASGRILFYPFGPKFSGYVVDSAREQAFRREYKRRDESALWLQDARVVPVLMAPFILAFYRLASSRPFLAVSVLLGSPLFVGLVNLAYRYWWTRRLAAGLERVPPLERAGSRWRLRLALWTAVVVAPVWLVLKLYQDRVGVAIASDDGASINFYPDISWPILGTIFVGLLAWAAVYRLWVLSGPVGRVRATLSAFVLVAAALGFAGHAVSLFLHPDPSVVLTRDHLSCRSSISWADISDMALIEGRYGKETVRLTYGPAVEDCEITGLNAGYDEVYAAIRSTWQAQSAQPAGASPAISLDHIPIGATRGQVVAALGEPVPIGDRSSKISFYLAPRAGRQAAQTSSDARVIAVYYDRNLRVERVARYVSQDGRYFDTISGAPATRLEDPVLFLIFLTFLSGDG